MVPPKDLCFFALFSLFHVPSAHVYRSFQLFPLAIISQSSTPRKHLSQTLLRLKPIEPIEISIGAKIQDPRSKIAPGSVPGNLGSWILAPIEISIGSIGFNRDPRFYRHSPGQSWILDLGSVPRLKFQSVQSNSIGTLVRLLLSSLCCSLHVALMSGSARLAHT